MSVRVRFAPSPTGHLHVGNVRTALFNWLFARKENGVLVLRVEDTDAARSEKEFEEQLVRDLRWLGLEWDEGFGAGGEFGPYRQTERLDLYRSRVRDLLDSGAAYYCFCSAEELEARRQKLKQVGQEFQYSGRCREISRKEAESRIASGERATVRLRVREGSVEFRDLVFGYLEIDTATIGDFILLRSDGSAQYNLACVVDDRSMNISHVIRGEGHISNTYRQLLIYESLGFSPPEFAHLSTILGSDGTKLSKRHGATSISEFQKAGYIPEAMVNYLSLLGWTPPPGLGEILQPDEIVQNFQIEDINRSPATFDLQKLNWVNREHLKKRNSEELAELSVDLLAAANLIPENPSREVLSWLASVIQLYRKYLNRLADLIRAADHLFDFDPQKSLQTEEVIEILSAPESLQVIEAFSQQILQTQVPIDNEQYKAAVLATMELTGQKGKRLFRPVRVAITGRASGPELEALIPVLEKGSELDLPTPVIGVRARVEAVLNQLDQ